MQFTQYVELNYSMYKNGQIFLEGLRRDAGGSMLIFS
jgi:hypothetical protein